VARNVFVAQTLGKFFLECKCFLEGRGSGRPSDHSFVQSCRSTKALKLSFAVTRIGKRRPNPDWSFVSIVEGRNATGR
jgi:hypothetical protein